MTIQNFVLDATSVGTSIGPTDGYVVNFQQVNPPYTVLGGPGYGRTQGIYQSGLIHLQGTGDPRPYLFIDANDAGIPNLAKVSQKYLGQMQILALPFNASYSIDLSDVYVPPS